MGLAAICDDNAHSTASSLSTWEKRFTEASFLNNSFRVIELFEEKEHCAKSSGNSKMLLNTSCFGAEVDGLRPCMYFLSLN